MKPMYGKSRASMLLISLSVVLLALCLAGLAGDQKGTVIESTEHYTAELVVVNGVAIHRVIINGPPEPPRGFVRETMDLPEPQPSAGVNTLSSVPAFDWSYGCSATSAAMISGYYDRTAFPDMYTGPTNGGVMPMTNSTWGHTTWPRFDGEPGTVSVGECPLSATRSGVDGRVAKGHVDDYWVGYAHPGPDPFIGNWAEHAYGDCTGDYMKTSQSIPGNTDGSTNFWYWGDGAPMTAADLEGLGAGFHDNDGGYGHKLFYESRGYTVTNMYNQYIQGVGSDPAQGYTYAQYKAEIDAGRPVIIHVKGHTMVGVGYDDSTNLMYIHDTWDYSVHTMTWGGSYSSDPPMNHIGVTIVRLAEPEIDVTGLGVSIPDGDTTPSGTDDTDFGTVNVGVSHSHTFTIRNTGQETLRLTGSPSVQVTGAHAADFAVTTQPASTTLAPAETTTFTVRFSPGAIGSRTATVTVANTDLNENQYSFSVQGSGDYSGSTLAVFRVEASGDVRMDKTLHMLKLESGFADVAEWVRISEPVEPGDVLELDPNQPGQYRKSRGACSPFVAGVVSTEPGVVLGSAVVDRSLPMTDSSSQVTHYSEALLALVGIVPVKVCDEGGPIGLGDLLGTASQSGYAKRSDPETCVFIVGKALEPFDEGEGMILVLLTR